MTAWREQLVGAGYAVLPSIACDPAEPWAYLHALWGERPDMVERQPIRPIAGARSFAGSRDIAPLHTDSQDYLGASPALQIMVCRRAAARGGVTRLVDGWGVVDRAPSELRDALFGVTRRHRFYFGDVVAPTIAHRNGGLVWTHSPVAPTDPIGETLAAELARAPVIELAIQTGETLVVDNHRMLHGRSAFDDPARDFVRVLAWLAHPIAVHPGYRAESHGARAIGDARLAVVLELLTGTPPAKLAAREGISEAELYAWRSRALASARSALEIPAQR